MHVIKASKPPSTLLPQHFKTELLTNDHITTLCRQRHFTQALQALQAFDFLTTSNTTFKLFSATYAALASACSSLKSTQHAKTLHEHIKGSNSDQDIVIQNHILNMYGKCRLTWDARKVFDEMRERNVVSWTSLIAGYSQNRQESEAVALYVQMLRSEGCCGPDQFTFGSVVKACAGLGNVALGRQVHAHVVKSENGLHPVAQNALTSMYVRFGLIGDAFDVFARVASKDLITWGSIIAGFTQLGYDREALVHFKEMMRQGGYVPNEFIFGSAFSACSGIGQPEYGRQIHGICVKFGLGRDKFAGCSLCDMYAKCGHLESATTVFCHLDQPDLVSWNAMISGFSSVGDANGALSFFSRMRLMGLIPDEVSVLSVLSAFTSSPTLSQGMQVHSYIMKTALDSTVSVCNALLTMYAKCSDLDDAFLLFNEMSSRADSVSWNAIITACMQHNQAGEVFRLLKLMLISEIRPDYITASNVVGTCSDVASLEVGNQIHCFTVKSGLVFGITVSNGLIDMYTKCGSLERAQKLFSLMENPDVVSWTSLIMGYAQCGYGKEALELFKKMKAFGVKPNEVTLVGVLTACTHIGLVEEGRQLYQTMESEHGIVPTREHCSCMVDLLARAGRLHEAEEFIKKMTFKPDIVVWKTLLAACKTHGNTEIGKHAAEKVLELDPSNSAALIVLCNVNASSGKWDEVARLRSAMRESGVKKVPGQSWIEIKDRVHVFLVDDSSHSERGQIYAMLKDLWLQMLDKGCDPLQP